MIDFRKPWQYFNGWYIEVSNDVIHYGLNGTSLHFSINKTDFNSNTEIKTFLEQEILNKYKNNKK